MGHVWVLMSKAVEYPDLSAAFPGHTLTAVYFMVKVDTFPSQP